MRPVSSKFRPVRAAKTRFASVSWEILETFDLDYKVEKQTSSHLSSWLPLKKKKIKVSDGLSRHALIFVPGKLEAAALSTGRLCRAPPLLC